MSLSPWSIDSRRKKTEVQQHWNSDHHSASIPRPVELTVLTQFFPPDYAATGQLIEELVRQLAQHQVTVRVFTGQPGYAFQTPSAPSTETIDTVVVKRSRIARLWPQRIRGKAINGILFCIRAGLHLFRACHRSNVLLLTTAPPFLPLLGYLANKLFGISYVCLLYDLYPDIANELGVIHADHRLSKVWNWMNCRIWQRASEIIVLSSTMKKRVVAKCPSAAGKTHIIHNWADPDRIVPIDKQQNWFAWKHHLVNTFTVLYSGNLGRCHDAETILTCANLLRNEPVQFLIVGSGAKNLQLMDRVNELGLQNFRFLPYQDKEDLPYSLTACDLALVSVEIGMEGLVAPSKLYSALASERPIAVICEEDSYLRQLIHEAQCGKSFQNGDAHGLAVFIQKLMSDRSLVQKMGRSGRAYLQSHFTPEHIAAQYAQVLHHAISSSTQQQTLPPHHLS